MALSNPAAGSWRLNVREIDKSSTIRGEAGGVGAMVIEAPRGPSTPIFISRGQEQRILDLYGTPSVTYPEVWEAIQFNYQDAMYICAPYNSDSISAALGGVLVHEGGVTGLSPGLDPSTGLDSYSFNSTDEYFVLTSKSPCTDWLGVQVTFNTTTSFFTITLYKTSDGGTNWTKINDYTVSTVLNQKDGFGRNIYVEEVFEDNDYLQAKVNSSADTANGFTDVTTTTIFTGGSRGDTLQASDRVTSWNYFQSNSTYPVDIFMDTSTEESVVTTFDTLRGTYQKYSSYLVPLPSGETATAAIATKDGYSVNNRGLAFYWNHMRVQDVYNNSSFWTSGIGKIGAKYSQMQDIFNGGAPAWIDENNHGGQLGSGILELAYDPTEDNLESLDNAGINALKYYPGYGVMITSQRSGQSPNVLSDYSWVAHSRLFDYIISNIISGVLIFQIVKLNDDYHRQIAVTKGNQLMDPILAEGLLADYAIQCDRNNNDDTALANRQFVYTIALKVTPYSETIVFNFINVGQSTDVTEVLA